MNLYWLYFANELSKSDIDSIVAADVDLDPNEDDIYSMMVLVLQPLMLLWMQMGVPMLKIRDWTTIIHDTNDDDIVMEYVNLILSILMVTAYRRYFIDDDGVLNDSDKCDWLWCHNCRFR